MNLEFYHFSEKPLEFDYNYNYKKDPRYLQLKPSGFWVSDENEYGWKEWCIDGAFRLEELKHCSKVTLNQDNNILFVRSKKDMLAFNKNYSKKMMTEKEIADYPKWFKEDYCLRILNLEKLYKDYGGIVITPYRWAFRLEVNFHWYYGWDCASGCIWDLKNIKEVELIEKYGEG